MKQICFVVFFLFLASMQAQAKEVLGELGVESIYLRPQILIMEPQQGRIDINEALVSLRWFLEPNTSARVKVGSNHLLYESSFFQDYSSGLPTGLNLIEAYGQYDALHGQFRMGRIPLPFGEVTNILEEDLLFSRSIQYSKNLVNLRNEGLSYQSETKNYFSALAIHNGDSQNNSDGQMWYTGMWGWKFSPIFKMGVTGQMGFTDPTSTANGSFSYLSFDKTQSAKWRLGGLFIGYKSSRVESRFEALMGSLEQNDQDRGQLSLGHWDLVYNYSQFGAALVRVQFFDPNTKLDNDYEEEFSLGLALKNETGTSSVVMLFTKKTEHPVDLVNDQFELAWKLSPYLLE